METSVFVARIFGASYIIIGAALLLNLDYYRRMIAEFCKSTSMIFYGGVIALAIGLGIVINHNIWAPNWTIMITLIGWAGILKGTWLLIFPKSAAKLIKFYEKYNNLFLAHSLAALTLGIALTILGYSAGR